MHLVFIDDSKQQSPSRDRVGPLVGMGALGLSADEVLSASRDLDALCEDVGFPDGEEFKWSPPSDSWMRSGLVKDAREQFLLSVVEVLVAHGCYAYFVAVDQQGRPATDPSLSPESDATSLLLERVASHLKRSSETAVVFTDRPSGSTSEENAYLGVLYALLSTGTPYVTHDEISIVAATQSRLVRLLQAADVVTSCLTAYVAGERKYSPRIASELLSILPTLDGRRGGVSVKLHPDNWYRNLYGWLFRDQHFKSGNVGRPLPLAGHPYYEGADSY